MGSKSGVLFAGCVFVVSFSGIVETQSSSSGLACIAHGKADVGECSSARKGTSKAVILWAIMRSGSSAMSRAFAQRNDSLVLFEPFTQAYYLGPEREHPRHLDLPPDPQYSYGEVWAKLLSPAQDVAVVFAKDFPVCLPRRMWTTANMMSVRHTFLIRHPAGAMTSMLKSIMDDSDRTGYTYFNGTEMSYGEMAALFRVVTEEFGQPPIVIDHDDLVANPALILSKYVEALGLDFQQAMLHWTKPLPPHPEIWWGFFESANTSSGFRQSEPRETQVPAEIAAEVQNALPFYEQLRSHRLQL